MQWREKKKPRERQAETKSLQSYEKNKFTQVCKTKVIEREEKDVSSGKVVFLSLFKVFQMCLKSLSSAGSTVVVQFAKVLFEAGEFANDDYV